MKLAVVKLDLPHLQEDRESGRCFEYLYAWMEGYCLCWDPYLLARLGETPVLVGPEQARAGGYDLLVVGGRQVTEELAPATLTPGLWLDPPEELLAGFAHVGRIRSRCERLSLVGNDEHYLPEWECYWGLEAGRDQTAVGEIGDRPLFVAERGIGVCACDFFRLFYNLQYRRPEVVKAAAATALTRALYAVLGEDPALAPPCSPEPSSLRRDFHSFGAMIEIFRFLLAEAGESCAALPEIGAQVVEAARAYVDGEADRARDLLGQAFRHLAAERQQRFPLKLYMVDTPHCGILFPEGSMFEAEWPHYLQEFLHGFLPFLGAGKYRLSLETSVVSLKELVRRYPRYADVARRLIAEGKLELVNGSWSGPLQQYSGLEAAYREFEVGQAALREMGLPIDSYVCQEFSFTPAFPGILRDLGYKTAWHGTQNRGWCPEGKDLFFNWQGADGRALPVLGQHHLGLPRRGSNTYIELPFTFLKAREENVPEMVVILMQDQGYIHLRFEMIRAHQYAPVFVEHATLGEIMAARAGQALPEQSFRMDEYYWEQPYWGSVSVDWLSGLERHYAYTSRLLGLESLAAAAGVRLGDALAASWETALGRESHDAELCSAATTGSFYHSMPDYEGPREGGSLGDLLDARQEVETAAVEAVEERALGALGLSSAVAAPGPAAVLNPWPAARKYGGLFYGVKSGLSLEGEGLRGGTLAGLGYVAGEIAGGAWEAVALSSVADGPDSLRASRPLLWEIAPGQAEDLVLTNGDLRLALLPRLAAGGAFRRLEAQTGAAGSLSWYEAHWLEPDQEIEVRVRLVQVAGSPLLHLDTETHGYDPGIVDKLENALYLRLETASDLLGHEAFISHFLQATRKEIITSPYLLLSRLPAGALTLINYGNIWHRVEPRAIEAALMFPLEGALRRRLALGWQLDDPIRAAAEMNEPLSLVAAAGSGQAPGAVQVEAPGVLVTSRRPEGMMRLAETTGQPRPVTLRFSGPVATAEFLYERGQTDRPVVNGAEVSFSLGAYEVVAVNVALA